MWKTCLGLTISYIATQLRGVQMRVVAITPIHVTDEELARRQERYTRLAPAGLTVELRNLTAVSPVALDLQSDVLSSDAALIDDMCHIGQDAADFILPDCVLDPGFRQGSKEEVVGMLESVTSHLVSQGHTVGAVTRNETIGAELVRRIGEYGFADDFAGLEVLNLSFDAINDEELWHKALKVGVAKLAAKGATVVINGCSAVNVDQSQLSLEVIDPAELALKLILEQKSKVTI